MQALSHIVRHSHYDLGLLLKFEVIDRRYEAAYGLSRILKNDIDFRSIMQSVERASGTEQGPPCQRQ